MVVLSLIKCLISLEKKTNRTSEEGDGNEDQIEFYRTGHGILRGRSCQAKV